MPKHVNQKSATLKSHNEAILKFRCTSAAGDERDEGGCVAGENKNMNFCKFNEDEAEFAARFVRASRKDFLSPEK